MGLFDTYKLAVDAEITTKTTPSSIDPADVGTKFKELCDLIEPVLTDIISVTASEDDPTGGSDGDIHFKSGITPIEVYQLISGTWTQTGEIVLVRNTVQSNAATTPFTSATLEVAYPDAIIGDEVICNSLTNEGPTIYKKVTETIWRSIPMATLE